MSKSRSRRRRRERTRPGNEAAGARVGSRRVTTKVVLPLAAVALTAAGAWYWYAGQRAESAFLEHARRGASAPANVTRPPNEGRGHFSPGQAAQYGSDPPTSGVHDPEWIKPGVYDGVQRRSKLVHSLEHGMIVVYYDEPDAAAWETLTAWAAHFDSQWSGLVLAPKPGLGKEVILTAWNRVLRLDRFDADAAAAFIDAFRGRGPEHPVR